MWDENLKKYIDGLKLLTVGLRYSQCRKMKSPMINLQIQRLMLLLLSDLTKDSRCIWSCEPIAMLKDYMLQCFLPCHPHHLRYGNAKDQSYIGITTPYGVWQELKMLIQHPLIATTSTSLSTSFFRLFGAGRYSDPHFEMRVEVMDDASTSHVNIPWDKKMLSIGGHTKDPSESTQVKVFDTHTCTWSMLETYGKPPVSRGGQSVTVVGKTLVIFGV
ncbi:hypothetical protein F2Q69_00038427 [Brassica cretica]|uniref:Uncharacterized protein n=1 Tax=Brassica cretica TaxID=69181 RepID=A0A8S9SLD4_BRACR|nr:hypothetical protein F2Q69_00038427 [Brassica cretica]